MNTKSSDEELMLERQRLSNNRFGATRADELDDGDDQVDQEQKTDPHEDRGWGTGRSLSV